MIKIPLVTTLVILNLALGCVLHDANRLDIPEKRHSQTPIVLVDKAEKVKLKKPI